MLNKSKSGFTVVEMAIVAPIIMLVIIGLISLIMNMTNDVMATRASNILTNDIENALNRIETDIRNSNGFIRNQADMITPTYGQGADDASAKFDSASALVLATYATTENPLSPTSGNVYTPISLECIRISMYGYPKMIFNTVYFVKDGTLWRRTIAPSNYSEGCNLNGQMITPWQLPSCAIGVYGNYCVVYDEKIVTGLSPSGNGIEYNYDYPDDLATFFITATKKVAGRTISRSGSIGIAKPDKDIAPTNYSLSDTWTNYGDGYNNFEYVRTTAGVVMLKGVVKHTNNDDFVCINGNKRQVIATLPVGFRPTAELVFTTTSRNNDGTYIAARIDVTEDGRILCVDGDSKLISLDGINFMSFLNPDASNPYRAFWPMDFENEWRNYTYENPDETYYANVAYKKDNIGRIHLQGLVRNGSMTDETRIFKFRKTSDVASDTDYWPSSILLMPANRHKDSASDASKYPYKMFGINPATADAGGIVVKSPPAADGLLMDESGWLSLQAMYYPHDIGNWVNINFGTNGSWEGYYTGTYGTPQYTKAADGIVTLRGLIKRKNTTSNLVTTLPPGYRPSHKAIWNILNDSGYSTLEISPDGQVTISSKDTGWFSLSNISFFAKPYRYGD